MSVREKHESTDAERIGYLEQRIRELKVTDELLRQQLRKVELRLRIAVSVASGATAGFFTSLLI